MISLLLKNGVRDDNSAILTTLFLESNKDLVKFILKHQAYPYSQQRMMIPLMTTSRKHILVGIVVYNRSVSVTLYCTGMYIIINIIIKLLICVYRMILMV